MRKHEVTRKHNAKEKDNTRCLHSQTRNKNRHISCVWYSGFGSVSCWRITNNKYNTSTNYSNINFDISYCGRFILFCRQSEVYEASEFKMEIDCSIINQEINKNGALENKNAACQQSNKITIRIGFLSTFRQFFMSFLLNVQNKIWSFIPNKYRLFRQTQ